jgi:hypothetical protein
VVADAAGVEFRHVPAESAEERFECRLLQASWQPCEHPESQPASGAWILLAEPGRVTYAAALGEALKEQGAPVAVRTLPLTGSAEGVPAPVVPSGPDRWRPQALVYLPDALSCDGAPPERLAREQVARLVETAQGLAEVGTGAAPRLWSVTTAAQQVLPGDRPELGQAGLRGLVRVLSYEHPEVRPGVLDTDQATPVRAVAAELLSCPDEQDEIAYRGGRRHLARLVNGPLDERDRHLVTVERGRDRVALRLARTGDLDSLEFVAQNRVRPAAGEVEVCIDATSVNFINVLQAMGVYERFSTGEDRGEVCAFDGAGVVTAVGEGVRGVGEGDRVAAMFVEAAQSAVMSSFATTRADCLLPVPDSVGAREAAALPCAYLTAWYALRHLAPPPAG